MSLNKLKEGMVYLIQPLGQTGAESTFGFYYIDKEGHIYHVGRIDENRVPDCTKEIIKELSKYREIIEVPLECLLTHPNPLFRNWAREKLNSTIGEKI